MLPRWKNWVHVTKLDPEKTLPPQKLEAVITSGTDALMLSGTLNVTRENLANLLEQVKAYQIPLVVEPADPQGARFDGVDLLFVPSVLNSTDTQWVVGKHRDWVMNHAVDWSRVIPEAYIVLNPNSAVGRVTASTCSLSPREAAAFALIAERYFRFPIVYVEYSGMYGDPAMVKAISDCLGGDAVLYYGGGIDSAERAAEMAKYADTIVIGNAVYTHGAEILKATVRAVQ
ncbi:MAG: phosphoglycerol geranylgeranyltransferase [Methanomicrobiales archaeon]|nr:phosphoglycerol geranylgeranyltransferase [Methanomicrobiales archaeon]MDI6875145.1 phosphoglycerol geranylgeranyltransferase [Methanomicrobiales archaeon]